MSIDLYAKYKLKDGKYDLDIYYKCDNDSNYSDEGRYTIDLN